MLLPSSSNSTITQPRRFDQPKWPIGADMSEGQKPEGCSLASPVEMVKDFWVFWGKSAQNAHVWIQRALLDAKNAWDETLWLPSSDIQVLRTVESLVFLKPCERVIPGTIQEQICWVNNFFSKSQAAHLNWQKLLEGSPYLSLSLSLSLFTKLDPN